MAICRQQARPRFNPALAHIPHTGRCLRDCEGRRVRTDTSPTLDSLNWQLQPGGEDLTGFANQYENCSWMFG